MATDDRSPPARMAVSAATRAQLQIAELRRLSRVKSSPAEGPTTLRTDLVEFFKQNVQKRQTRLTRIAECFGRIVPSPLLEHCAVESLNRGALTILCDSSPHLFDLKTLLLAGMERQLLLACRGDGLRKITLKPGRWYEGDGVDRKVKF
jgi:hypothetical protein